jgi:hypothetical protein
MMIVVSHVLPLLSQHMHQPMDPPDGGHQPQGHIDIFRNLFVCAPIHGIGGIAIPKDQLILQGIVQKLRLLAEEKTGSLGLSKNTLYPALVRPSGLYSQIQIMSL